MTDRRAEIRARLLSDFGFFCAAIEKAEAVGRDLPAQSFRSFDPDTEAAIAEAVAGLRTDGFFIWRGMVPDDRLAALRDMVQATRQRSATLDFPTKQVTDPATGYSYLKPKSGRTRATLALDGTCTVPPPVADLCRDAVMVETVRRAYRCAAAPQTVCFEHLLPCNDQLVQWWHIDRVMDQCKLMLLLTDVGETNGPMLMARGSHRFHGRRRAIDFLYFREGPDFSDVPASLAFAHETVPSTGKAGDAIFFNTKMYHGTGRADDGERATATVYFSRLDTPLNRFLARHHPGHWI